MFIIYYVLDVVWLYVFVFVVLDKFIYFLMFVKCFVNCDFFIQCDFVVFMYEYLIYFLKFFLDRK